MTLKQKLLAIKQSNSTQASILSLVDWMLKNEHVTAARKVKGWGLYGPTHTSLNKEYWDKWKDYIL